MAHRRKKLLFLVVSLLLFFASPILARQWDQIPQSKIETIIVTTDDGVAEKLIHLKNPGKPILLMEPGLGAQGTSLELPSAAAYLQGDFDVFIGNWRGSAPLPRGLPIFGARNGLEQVIHLDFPAHLRHLIHHYASPAQLAHGISLFGHSMGGMMIMGMLSDPKLSAEFAPYLRNSGHVLFQSPHHVKYLNAPMVAAALVGVPALNLLKRLGVQAIDMHTRFLQMSKNAKRRGGITGLLLTPAIERFAMALTRLALNPIYTGREKFRDVFFKMGAHSIPIDLLLDFATALQGDGQLRDSSGKLLIRPDAVQDFHIQIVRAKNDVLAPWQEQEEYFKELGVTHKQLLSIAGMNHTDTVIYTEAGANFFHHVLEFLKNPQTAAANASEIIFRPNCEQLLHRNLR